MQSVFQNQVVWVTGASSGIGEAMARDFVQRGAKVVLTARRRERLDALARELNAGHETATRAKVLTADLSDASAAPALAQQALALFGSIDVLFNNAGVSQRGFAIDTPFEVERRMVELDLLSPIALTKAVLPHFAQKKSGRIIVTSSLMGDLELPGNTTYACVKHGLNGYFYSLAYELKPLGIQVQVLQPGFVKTEVSESSITADGSRHGTMDSTHVNAMSAETFARKALRRIERGDVSIFIAGKEGLAIPVRRWFPGLYRRVVEKSARRLLRERIPEQKLP